MFGGMLGFYRKKYLLETIQLGFGIWVGVEGEENNLSAYSLSPPCPRICLTL